MSEWMPIESAPKDLQFLACIEANPAETKLLKALGMADDMADYREVIVAHKRKGDPKHKIRSDPHGRLYTASHWMPLPALPEKKA